MNLQFGTGVLYAEPNAGNLPTNPTPIRLLLQETSIDIKGDLKKLWTQSQFPIAKARGKVDVTGKSKAVNFDPLSLNQLFFAQTAATGMEIPVDRELATIAANAATVTLTPWATDNGVVFTTGSSAGLPLLKVASAPATGQYVAPNATTGIYQFANADNGKGVAISYTYTNSSRGQTVSLTNQLMGYAPECRIDLWNNFRGKIFGLRLNSVVIGSWGIPTKLEDFWQTDVSFEASTDASDSLGKLFGDNF